LHLRLGLSASTLQTATAAGQRVLRPPPGQLFGATFNHCYRAEGARTAILEGMMPRLKHQELLKGLIRLHILHHAAREEFYGQWMIHELARHGYTLSPGTLYPMLHALERGGYLRSRQERDGRTFRRLYRATALGREADKIAKVQVRELTGQGRKRRAAAASRGEL
jgi:PadR family transcriptional regulator PadR